LGHTLNIARSGAAKIRSDTGIPEDMVLRLNIAHLGKSHELLTVAKALSG
jgi:hypothetical protein